MSGIELQNGDRIWINDSYGSFQPAVVTSVSSDGNLYATSARQIAGDSRYIEWTIQADRVSDMVFKRDAAII